MLYFTFIAILIAVPWNIAIISIFIFSEDEDGSHWYHCYLPKHGSISWFLAVPFDFFVVFPNVSVCHVM